jgi:hypothetical protein
VSVKVVIKEKCETSAQERMIRYMQDSFGWTEGRDFEIERPPLVPDSGDELHNCVDCGGPFTFSIGEQQFYSKNGLRPPKRCKVCRDKRKAEKQNNRVFSY